MEVMMWLMSESIYAKGRSINQGKDASLIHWQTYNDLWFRNHLNSFCLIQYGRSSSFYVSYTLFDSWIIVKIMSNFLPCFFQGRKFPPFHKLQDTKIIISQISMVINGCIQFLCVGLYESPDVLHRNDSEGVFLSWLEGYQRIYIYMGVVLNKSSQEHPFRKSFANLSPPFAVP